MDAGKWARSVVLSGFVVAGILYGGSKSELNRMPRCEEIEWVVQSGGASRLRTREADPSAVVVTPEEVERGFRLAEVSTNAAHSYEMPTNAATVGNWHLRGAFRDWTSLGLGGLVFPLGTNEVTRFAAFTDGRLRPSPRDAAHEICAVGVPMLAVQGESRLWSAADADGSRVVTWERFFLNADTKAPVSAQVRLFADGAFETRSNEVGRAYERIHPSDWDGDGIPNAIDEEPLVRNGDFYGPGNVLPQNANVAAYRTVAIASEGDAVAEVVFSGDGTSNYPDPHFMARPHSVNEVTILVGKTYTVTSDAPIGFLWSDDAETCVWTNGANSLVVQRPVTVSYEFGGAPQMRGRARSRSSGVDVPFRVNVSPAGLDGETQWSSSACCAITGGPWFSYDCDGTCNCGGCQLQGSYRYEGFPLSMYAPTCPCGTDPGSGETEPEDPPQSAGTSVAFEDDVIFYEEAYANAPGDSVARRVSKNAKLTCTAYGGEHGGVFTFTKANFDKLTLVSGNEPPETSVELSPGESRRWEATYAPLTHSASEGDIHADVHFAENLSGDVYAQSAQMSVVELELTPATLREGFPNRHCWGVRETVHCSAKPDVGEWNTTGGGVLEPSGSVKDYTCPLVSDGSTLKYSAGSASYNFNITIVEPSAIVAIPDKTLKFGLGPNQAGGIGLKFNTYVMPMHVSFSGIAMEEVPSNEGFHDGFFANNYFCNEWYHTVEHEAGRWGNVRPDNFCGDDRAYWGSEIPRILPDETMTFNPNEGVWTDGRIVWRINWGWAAINRNFGDIPVKEIATPYNQTFRIDEYGTVSVTKFQCMIIRGTNNVIRMRR